MAIRKAGFPIQEFAWIKSLQTRFASSDSGLIRGMGDDAAIIAASPQLWWHVTTDLLTEGVHFDLRTASPETVGYRAAMANLSDIAAMGAAPRYLLTSIAIPKGMSAAHLDQLYRGLMKACGRYGVSLIGGDTSASRAGLFISLTLIGTAAARHALLRSGARIGDGIYVTGTLGDSHAGLGLLTRRPEIKLSTNHRRFLINRHLRPAARVGEGQWLNTSALATAAIDISDGLSGDLRHICEESRVGADVELDAIPISPACRAYARAVRQEPANLALAGGEDYELLFTVPPDKHRALERQAKNLGYEVTRIGVIRPRRSGLRLQSHDGAWLPFALTSYEHFC